MFALDLSLMSVVIHDSRKNGERLTSPAVNQGTSSRVLSVAKYSLGSLKGMCMPNHVGLKKNHCYN